MTPTPQDPVSSPAAAVPRRRWRAGLLTLVLMALLAGSAWYLVQRAKTPAGAAGEPGVMPMGGHPGGGPAGGPPGGAGGPGAGVTVGLALAEQGALALQIDALGTVTAPVTATLVPQVSGVLAQVLFSEGQRVRKGQLLARIDERSYQQALAQAKGQTARDQAQLAAARVTLQRYQELWQQDSVARQTLDTQQALVQQLEAALQADLASEGVARLNLEHTQIRAPIDGLIGLRAVDPGNLVGSSTAGGIASITQVQPIDVLFAVPQDHVLAVQAAQRSGPLVVQVFDRGRTQQLAQGRFLTLDNQISTSTGTVRAKARFDNADGALFPNQFVNARLLLGQQAGVLVPVTALRTGPQGDYVYVVDGQQVAQMRAVVRGIASAERVLIRQGLQAGERVVTEGGDRVKPGTKVRLARPAAAKGGPARPAQPAAAP
ncbi:multidrug efflux RND transporter periplasmic adaptor subunit MuxA [Melaminivora sp.]